MTSTPFDFAPLMPAGLPAPVARWTGLAKYSFVGGNNDPDQVPVDGLLDALGAVLKREGKTLATYGLAHGPQGYRPLRQFLAAKLKRDAGIACTDDDVMVVSGSLQALDLVNQTLLARGDTVVIEQDTYQGALNRLTRLGINVVGIPLDHDGMRMDALAAALVDLKRRGITPKYIYTIPTVQNPTGTIMPETRRAELLKLSQQYGVPIFEDDCYADLIWDGKRPPALHAMSNDGGVIHIGSFSKSIAPALRVGFIVAPWQMLSRMLALKTDAGSGAARADGARGILRAAFHVTCAEVDSRPARQARHADGSAQRAIWYGCGIRRSQRRHLPVGEAAGSCRYAKVVPVCARRRRRDQSRPGVVHRQELCGQPTAVVLRQSIPRANPRRRRPARRSVPQRIRRAGADRQCGAARPSVIPISA
jgi:histidinol-phosphate/aromatic aminotransferase/cobyric acid decarboxylase-like protein